MRDDLYYEPASSDERERVGKAFARVLSSRQEVILAYLHGSYAQGRFYHDVDVAVLLREPPQTFRTLFALSDLLQKAGGLSKVWVDVRALNDAPLTFKGVVIESGILLYARDRAAKAAYEAETLGLWFDFKPYRNFIARKLLNRPV